MLKRFLTIFLLLFAAGSSRAACTGALLVWACPAGATVSDINTMIGSATDGAVATFANGSYTLASWVKFANAKGMTLICASVGGCTIHSGSNQVFGGDSFTGTNTKFYRISGFVFDAGGATPSNGFIWFDGDSSLVMNGTGLGGFRIDHNTFQNAGGGTIALFFGHNISSSQYYGVIDHNTFQGANQYSGIQYLGNTPSSYPATQLGSEKNIFLEDNTYNFTAMTNASNGGCTDIQGNGSMVFRHNTVKNCLTASHGVTHGGGPANYEYYNNASTLDANATGDGSPIDCYRCFHHQGSGSFMGFSNTFSAPNSTPNSEVMSVLHYRDYGPPPSPNGSIDNGLPFCDGTQGIDGNRSTTATNRGYPCFNQPGRDASNAHYLPMYAWNNTYTPNSSQVVLTVSNAAAGTPDYYPNHMQNDREWFNAVSINAQTTTSSPFNGTTGMGFGTFANRPTTCTTSTESAFGGAAGVGYFATDVGTQGTLYTCSATNTWTVYYTPFQYPHPLVGGSSFLAPAPASTIFARGMSPAGSNFQKESQ